MKQWPRSYKNFKTIQVSSKVKLNLDRRYIFFSTSDFYRYRKNYQYVPNNKASGCDIPIQMIKQFGFTYQILTDCVNYAIIKNAFPYSLKKAHITPVHKRAESTDQENNRPVNMSFIASMSFVHQVF